MHRESVLASGHGCHRVSYAESLTGLVSISGWGIGRAQCRTSGS